MKSIAAVTYGTTTTGTGGSMVIANGRASLWVDGIGTGSAAGTVKLQIRPAGVGGGWTDAASVTANGVTNVGPFAGEYEYRINMSAHGGSGDIIVGAFGQDEMR